MIHKQALNDILKIEREVRAGRHRLHQQGGRGQIRGGGRRVQQGTATISSPLSTLGAPV